MREDKLYEAITLIDDDLIDETAGYTPKKKRVIHWKRWTALAACLVLVAGAGGILLNRLGGAGGSSNGGGGSGADGSSTFMSYAGPVFPLTTLEDAGGLTAQRDITLDFAPWVPVWISNEEEAAALTDLTEEERRQALADYNTAFPDGGYWSRSTDILVTDAYTLTNTADEDKTLTFLYPFVSSLRDLDARVPALTADGAALETDLFIGPYSGGFAGAWGSGTQTGEQLNLDQLNSWEEYQALLTDGSYLEKALSEFPDLSGVPVTVYEFTNAWGPERSSEIPNPSIRVTFDLDYSATTVLCYGFHMCSRDRDAGRMDQGFSIPQPQWPGYGEPYYLIAVGEDVENMDIRCYVTGGWDTKEEISEFGVTVGRYETDLDAILRRVVGNLWHERIQYGVGADSIEHLDFETFYGLYCDHLLTYGVLAGDGGIERYDTGWLENLDVSGVDRVCYLQAQLTISAGESVTLSAQMTKPASFDHYCAHTENQGVYGYDMVTRLGSTLTFTGQTATLEDRGQIEIVRQNFGFDLERGVRTAKLDPDAEHYYLEVRRLPETTAQQ